MSIDPVAQLRRYHAALNAYDEGVVMPMFAVDAVYDSPGVNGRISGRAAIIAAFTAYFTEHPDQHAIDETVILTESRTVQSVWRLEAISRSNGQRIVRRGTECVTFDADGLIRHVEVTDA